jgi:hypothetical protein
MKYRINLFIFLLCLLTINTSAQRKNVGNWVQGFIVDNKQDTIHGLVEIEDYELAEIRVKFKKKYGREYSKKKTYKTDDIVGYAVKVRVNNNSDVIQEEWIAYVKKEVMEAPRPFGGKTVFLQQREIGVLNLYVYYIRSNSSVNTSQYFIIESANAEELIKVTEDNFDEIVKKYIVGCSQVKNRIGRADFSYLNLDRIVYFYNRCQIADAQSDIAN